MNKNPNPFKFPPGCLIAVGLVGILCMGFIGTAALTSMASAATPIPSTETNAFIDLAIETTQEFQAKTPTSPTSTAVIMNTALPRATATPLAFPIPVTGGSCIPANPPQTGRVVQVVDGDTIKVVLDQDGRTYSVRYIGMDTPEDTTQVEAFGPEATATNSQFVEGKLVTLIKDVSETDRYGRLLRYVIADGVFVNYELVAQGYATTASYPPDVACIPDFQAAERRAFASRLGLWAVPPTQAVIAPTLPPDGNTSADVPCNCSGPDLDCKDFSSHASAQSCYGYCRAAGYGDVFRLDGNDTDGLACESLP